MENSTNDNFSIKEVHEDARTQILGKKDISLQINTTSLTETVQELGIVQLTWPNIVEPVFEGRNCFPESYYRNSNKEKLLLTYAENFRRQFCLKFPDRQPLLLQAQNECGIQKMVCTTIRPTRISYPDLLKWRECAIFVADYLNYEPLSKPILQVVEE